MFRLSRAASSLRVVGGYLFMGGGTSASWLKAVETWFG